MYDIFPKKRKKSVKQLLELPAPGKDMFLQGQYPRHMLIELLLGDAAGLDRSQHRLERTHVIGRVEDDIRVISSSDLRE